MKKRAVGEKKKRFTHLLQVKCFEICSYELVYLAETFRHLLDKIIMAFTKTIQCEEENVFVQEKIK